MMDPETLSNAYVQRTALQWLRDRLGLGEAQWQKGVPEDGSRCAIAQVLLAGGYQDPEVDETCLTAFLPDGLLVALDVPPLLQEFILRFDQGCYPDLLEVAA